MAGTALFPPILCTECLFPLLQLEDSSKVQQTLSCDSVIAYYRRHKWRQSCLEGRSIRTLRDISGHFWWSKSRLLLNSYTLIVTGSANHWVLLRFLLVLGEKINLRDNSQTFQWLMDLWLRAADYSVPDGDASKTTNEYMQSWKWNVEWHFCYANYAFPPRPEENLPNNMSLL